MSFFTSAFQRIHSIVSQLVSGEDDHETLPSERCLLAIQLLRTDLNTAVELDKHYDTLVALNQTIFDRSNGEFMKELFEEEGPQWKVIGFQHENPLKDIRGGGLLSLKNIIYFIKTNDKAIDIIRSRSYRENGANYPWAAAAINITRLLAKLFEVVATNGFSQVQEHSRRRYWDLLEDETELDSGFHRCFSTAMVVLDDVFSEINGSYLDFPRALQITEERMLTLLNSSDRKRGEV